MIRHDSGSFILGDHDYLVPVRPLEQLAGWPKHRTPPRGTFHRLGLIGHRWLANFRSSHSQIIVYRRGSHDNDAFHEIETIHDAFADPFHFGLCDGLFSVGL